MTIIASERDVYGNKWILQKQGDGFMLDCPNRISIMFTEYRQKPVPIYPRREGIDLVRIEKRNVPDGVLGTIQNSVEEVSDG